MKLFIDTNILIDLADIDREEHQNAVKFFTIAKSNKIQLFTTADTIATTAYYLKNAKTCRRFMKTLVNRLTIISITNKTIETVNSREHPDYEDSMHIVCAEENGMSAIITKDKKHYNEKYTWLPVLSEEEFANRHFSC